MHEIFELEKIQERQTEAQALVLQQLKL